MNRGDYKDEIKWEIEKKGWVLYLKVNSGMNQKAEMVSLEVLQIDKEFLTDFSKRTFQFCK